MNENVRNKINRYRRELQDEKVNTTLYSFVFILTIVGFGLFGIIPVYRVAVEKYNTLKELNELNKNLAAKRDGINELSIKLNDAKYHISELKKVVTPTPEIENYMISLVGVASKNGFKQKSLAIQGKKDSVVSLSVSLQGPVTQMHSFLGDVENLSRLSVVKGFNYSNRENSANLNMSIDVFYLPE